MRSRAAPALRIELGIDLRTWISPAKRIYRSGTGAATASARHPRVHAGAALSGRASAACRATEGMPRRRGDAALLDKPLLHDSDVTGWRTWFDALGVPSRARRDRRFEDYNLVLAAAEAGPRGAGAGTAPTPISSVANSCATARSRFGAQVLRACEGENRPEVLALMERMRAAVGQAASPG